MHSGGLVNVVTRSGTNQYHGSGFEFIRNNYIDATNFFSSAKDTLHQNQYGGTFGGPILRDKLFAFAGYQRTVSNQSQAPTRVSSHRGEPGRRLVCHRSRAYRTNPAGTKTRPALRNHYINSRSPHRRILPGNKYATTPTYNAQSLALMKYLPPIDPVFDVTTAESSPTPSRRRPLTTSS